MPTPSEEFFNEYAKAYESYDPNAVAANYFLPAVIMSDDTKNVYTSHEAITNVIDELMDKLQGVGVTFFDAEVCQSMRLSESILFSNVKWTFKDVDEQTLFSCFVSYTLQVEDGALKIVVSVIDDEERELEKLLFPMS